MTVAVAAATAEIPTFAPAPAAGDEETSSRIGNRIVPRIRPMLVAQHGDEEAPDRHQRHRSPGAHRRGTLAGEQARRRRLERGDDDVARLEPEPLGRRGGDLGDDRADADADAVADRRDGDDRRA